MFLLTFFFAAGIPSAQSQIAPLFIPHTNAVVSYRRVQPVFKTPKIEKAHGDAFLAALDEGKAVERWMKNGLPEGVVCALPMPPRVWLELTLTNGTTLSIGITQDGGLLHLPNGFYEVTDKALSQTSAWMTDMAAALRAEVINTPKPFTYKIGTLDGDGTLSGLARVFYGDASKWKHIYEANRKIIKNPHVISGHETIIIPKLK